MFSISHNIPEIKDKLQRIKILLTRKPTWQDDVVNQARKAQRELRRLTPKSKGIGGQVVSAGEDASGEETFTARHLRDGWDLHVIGRGGKDRAPVLSVLYNAFTHGPTGQVLQGKGKYHGRGAATTVLTVLDYLEYGTRPHIIRPVDAEALRFVTREGETVFTKMVHHPGTRPYGMIRLTRAKVRDRMRRLTARWSARVALEWGK